MVYNSAATKALWYTGTSQSAVMSTLHADSEIRVDSHGGSSANLSDRMLSGQWLNPGEKLVSPNRVYTLELLRDGNFVLWKHVPLWGSKAAFGYTASVAKIFMQPDGNLVGYTSAMAPVFQTKTNNKPGAFLVIQSDGNGVLYSSDSRTALWSTGTVLVPPSPAPSPAPVASIFRMTDGYTQTCLNYSFEPANDAYIEGKALEYGYKRGSCASIGMDTVYRPQPISANPPNFYFWGGRAITDLNVWTCFCPTGYCQCL